MLLDATESPRGVVLVDATIMTYLPQNERLALIPFTVCPVCGKPVLPWENGIHAECEERVEDRAWAFHMLGGDDR